MTLYERCCRLELDLAQIGLERGDSRGGYFCDPVGAEAIGWAGVDGIHFCFVEGFGETVFAVSPANGPGDYVHPLARSFEDFLRLVLACGGVDALEQAWMWNRGEFNAYLETYPPGPEQRAVLDGLRETLGLAPMDDPYGYLKGVQSGFDYGALKFSKEYYELAGEPEPAAPSGKKQWKVYFHNGFGRHWGHDRPGKEIPVSKTVSWGGKVWHIPAVYSCGKGLVVDLCVEIDPAELRAFREKWETGEEDARLTPEDQERRDAENPMNLNYRPRLTVNGRTLEDRSGVGVGWTPDSCRPEGERSQQDWECRQLMEHYGLDQSRGWMFWRDSFPWATKTKPAVKTVSLSLEGEAVSIPGPRFTVSGAGDAVPFTHPVTGQAHILRVVGYEEEQVDMSCLEDGWDYPAHCTVMSYVTEPDLPRESLAVRDCGQGDSPRPKPLGELAAVTATGGADGPTAACSIGIIGGSDGPTAILATHARTFLDTDPPQLRSASSALRFEPPEELEWRMVFRKKTVEGITVELLP